jgi:nitrate/TMAO reductase-like tetraheme cytochrome c subunit
MIKGWGIGIVLVFAFTIFAFAQEEYSPSSASPASTPAKNQSETATYVGIDKCKICHTSQFKDFQERRFDKAWKVLKMRGKEKDPECVKCHVTGYGEPGGFVNEEATPHLKYKQCESCHGPGSTHANNPADIESREGMKKYANRPNTCTDCHRGVIAHRIAIKGF